MNIAVRRFFHKFSPKKLLILFFLVLVLPFSVKLALEETRIEQQAGTGGISGGAIVENGDFSGDTYKYCAPSVQGVTIGPSCDLIRGYNCYKGTTCNAGDLSGYYARTPATSCPKGYVCCKPPADSGGIIQQAAPTSGSNQNSLNATNDGIVPVSQPKPIASCDDLRGYKCYTGTACNTGTLEGYFARTAAKACPAKSVCCKPPASAQNVPITPAGSQPRNPTAGTPTAPAQTPTNNANNGLSAQGANDNCFGGDIAKGWAIVGQVDQAPQTPSYQMLKVDTHPLATGKAQIIDTMKITHNKDINYQQVIKDGAISNGKLYKFSAEVTILEKTSALSAYESIQVKVLTNKGDRPFDKRLDMSNLNKTMKITSDVRDPSDLSNNIKFISFIIPSDLVVIIDNVSLLPYGEISISNGEVLSQGLNQNTNYKYEITSSDLRDNFLVRGILTTDNAIERETDPQKRREKFNALFASFKSSNSPHVFEQEITSLNNKQTLNYTFEKSYPLGFDKPFAYICTSADPENRIAESDEIDNIKCMRTIPREIGIFSNDIKLLDGDDIALEIRPWHSLSGKYSYTVAAIATNNMDVAKSIVKNKSGMIDAEKFINPSQRRRIKVDLDAKEEINVPNEDDISKGYKGDGIRIGFDNLVHNQFKGKVVYICTVLDINDDIKDSKAYSNNFCVTVLDDKLLEGIVPQETSGVDDQAPPPTSGDDDQIPTPTSGLEDVPPPPTSGDD